jgi:hypothetical protein
MKKLMLLLVGIGMFVPVQAAVIDTHDFSEGVEHGYLSDYGWTGSTAGFFAYKDDDGDGDLEARPFYSEGYAYRTMDATASSIEGQIYFGAEMQPVSSTTYASNLGLHLHGLSSNLANMRFQETGTGTDTFNLFYGTVYGSSYTSTNTFVGSHVYEVYAQLTLDTNNTAGALGTVDVMVKDVTAGDTSFSAVAGLTGVNAQFKADWVPGIDTWVLRGTYAGYIDDLEYGTGVVPEPATLSLLGAGVLGLISRRKKQ